MSLFLSCWFAAAATCFAQQPRLKELPVIEKPRQRGSEIITVRTRPALPSKGVLAVAVNPYLSADVVVKDAAGLERARGKADKETGQIEFQLPRKKVYQVEVSYPGYLSTTRKSKPLGGSTVVSLSLTPQYAAIRLRDLPPNAQVWLDGQMRAASDQSGVVNLNDISPGDHSVLVQHAEYNDYSDKFEKLEAGATATLNVRLIKVAKLTIQALPGATLYIDGALQGRVNADGAVNIDYELEQAAEHTIAVELLGYQTWTRKELLTPGPRTLSAKLDPIVTSAGVTDGFASLAQWNAPATWKIVSQKGKELDTSKLQVSGPGIGMLKEKTYRDFTVTFTVWLSDEKGASWVVRADRTGRNYYLFHLSGLKAGELTPRRLYTYRVKDGQQSEVETPTPMTLDFKEKDSYYITVSVRGNQIKHTLQAISTAEESGASYTDTFTDKDLFLYGSFGFTSFKGEVFLVDDLLLDPAKE